MNGEVSPEAKRIMEAEQRAHEAEVRAHRIRMDLLSRPGLLERLHAARESVERGEGMTLEELEAELARLE